MNIMQIYYTTSTVLNCIIFIVFLINFHKIMGGTFRRRSRIDRIEDRVNELVERNIYMDSKRTRR